MKSHASRFPHTTVDFFVPPNRCGADQLHAAAGTSGKPLAGALRRVTRLLACSMAVISLCAPAHAAIVNTNESLTTAAASIPAFTLPAGTNLLNSGNPFTPSSPAGFVHGSETTSSSWATLIDGGLGTAGSLTAANTPNNGTSLVIPLDLSVNTRGYDLTQFDAYGAWGDSGRDNLNFTIQFSTVQAPTVFLNLATINNQTVAPVNSTHTRLTENSTGILARWVHSVRFVFAGQENSWVGYREFILQGTPSLTAPGHLRVMPLGDSITWGDGAPGGYRNKLYQSLTAAGYAVDFVGNHTENPVSSLPDPDQQGHRGWIIGQIDASITGWFNSIADPDVILLHIGTNDFGTNTDTPNAINRLDALITKMATLRPYAHIIVTNIMERGEPQNTAIQAQFNPYVQARVDAQAALGRRVTFLDMRSAVPISEMPDQLHPGQVGYDHMADAWLPAIQAVVGTEGDSLPPGILRAQGLADLTHVTITFSKPVADSAANPANFSLSGGLTVSAASLDPGKRIVTLTTSPQTNTTPYTATVNGVVDRTGSALPLAANSTVNFNGATLRGYLNNVPESAGYTLAYSLDIPNAANYTAGPVSYAVDNHHSVGPFSRVAYYLELQTAGGDVKYVWASANAFTSDAGKIAVPTYNSGAIFQQAVTGMNVVSNVAGVSTGTGLAGNIEFWPNTYLEANGAPVAGASGATYDFGDTRTTGSYGSMQLHNTGAAQTVFGFNNWATSPTTANCDLGIGNGTGAHPDWTFTSNAPSYTVKTLQVLVRTIGDTTAPAISSANATFGRTQVLVHFSEPLAAASVKPEYFSLDNGVTVLAATLAPNQHEVYLTTTAQPPAATLTLTVSNVRDSSPAANIISPATTVVVTAPALPAEIVTNIGATANNYQLVASIDLPVQGNFNAGNAAYTLDDRAAIGAYTKVAYYLELQKPSQPSQPSQYVWVSMDPFTGSRSKLTIPTSASGAVFQQNVTNMNVVSNVAGVVNGSTATGGNIEFWPHNYTEGNVIAIPNASAAVFDTGDTRSADIGYGSLQIHNHDVAANQTVLAVNDFGVDGKILDAGIGNNPAPVNGAKDWTFSNNAATYSRRVLHVMVLPGLPVVPASVAANVPASTDYQLAYSLNVPTSGNSTSLIYSVNNSAVIGSFKRIAYYLELQTGAATPQYIWTSMDAFTADPTKIAVPTAASGAFFQQNVTNMDVLSNVAGIVNGTTATGGNIEFWPSGYNQSNAIGISGASASTFDFGDGGANGTAGHGSMQVHNHTAGQTLLAFNHFGATSGTFNFGLGIGNRASATDPDWTFADNAATYSNRTLHVFVLPGDPDATGPTLISATPSTTLNRLFVKFNEALSDSSAIPANFSIPGLTVTGATILAGNRDIALTTSAQTPSTVYTLNVSGVRDRSPAGNLILPGASTTFTAFSVPAILANIPETSGYKLIHQLALPSAVPRWNNTTIPYSVDESKYGEMLFDRVAYLLELDGKWAYASFDRHTNTIAKVGIPTLGVTGTPLQQTVSNMNVVTDAASSLAGIVNGTGIATGNIEFWGANYTGANGLGIPNASASAFDFGDTMTAGGHGCLQVHNYDLDGAGAGINGQTILAYNNWGSNTTGSSEMGIGTNPNGAQAPDWTSTANAASYTTRNLYVLVRPGSAAIGVAPTLLSQLDSRSLNSGDTTTFAISATGSPSFTYQWRFNGGNIIGATSPWFVLGPVGSAQAGNYDVVVTGANQASTTSNVAVVSVGNPLAFGGYSFTTRKNTAQLVARSAILAKATGQSLDLTSVSPASAQGGSVTLAPAGVTYTPASGFLGNDSFTVTITDGFSNNIIGTVNATVTAAAAISPGQSLVAIRTDGKVDLLFSATALQGYAIQRSDDLAPSSWETLTTRNAGDDGLVPFTDPNPPAGKAFYRLTWVQP
ncbi:MAG: GDSL-type esterase/lipase family protein [Verrucomicrobiota bacterium]